MSSDLEKYNLFVSRGKAALRSLLVGDALAMPVHWFYDPAKIETAFPGGVQKFEDAPQYHPSSIMSLHSTSRGGRGLQGGSAPGKQIVGDVILKGKRKYWGQPNMHYHQGMKAGENTLNAHCARVLMRSMAAANGYYDKNRFLDDYISFMTAEPPLHPDTYAESYHRAFFANLAAGLPKETCAAKTHDTPSVGGLVGIAPLAITELLRQRDLEKVKALTREHLYLFHPDENLAKICAAYVELLDALLFRATDEDPRQYFAAALEKTMGLDLTGLARRTRNDSDIVGGRFSIACYITDSWPSLMYLAYRYAEQPEKGLLANTNLGGDNVHRGSVLGVLLGLVNAETVDSLYCRLLNYEEIEAEINALLPLAKMGSSNYP